MRSGEAVRAERRRFLQTRRSPPKNRAALKRRNRQRNSRESFVGALGCGGRLQTWPRAWRYPRKREAGTTIRRALSDEHAHKMASTSRISPQRLRGGDDLFGQLRGARTAEKEIAKRPAQIRGRERVRERERGAVPIDSASIKSPLRKTQGNREAVRR